MYVQREREIERKREREREHAAAEDASKALHSTLIAAYAAGRAG
jgi:hypothetical protein